VTDGSFPDRLSQLRARWEADPSSRVFLQLAEEYRHLGRVQDALAVLDKGLKEHPGYLSALVAKGRCLLELGESMEARAVLERVVQQDATQMVANKLLVRAYIETGEAERARERLDLYSLLNDSDPEIEDLRRRAKALERAAQAPPPVPPPPPVPEVARTAGPTGGTAPLNDDPFADLIAAPPRKAEPPADIFDFGPPAAPAPPPALDFVTPAAPPLEAAAPAPAPAAPAAASDDVFDLGPPPAGAAAGAADDDLFGLFGDFDGGPPAPSRSRYLESLASEGIFDLGEPLSSPSDVQAAAAPAPSLPVFEPPPFAAETVEPEPLPAFAPEPLPAYAPEPLPAPLWEPQPSFEPAAPAAFEPAEPVFDELPPLVPGESPFPPPAAPVGFSEPLPFAPESLAPAPPEPLAPDTEPEAARPAATVTLGELYLEQGHPREAERIFGEVLDREPGNPAALAGLERARVTPPVHRPLDAAQLLEGYDPDDPQGATGRHAKKVHLLTSYLKRLRQGSRSRHVS
jgi:tetratricopeptide (TPR) repeat protein